MASVIKAARGKTVRTQWRKWMKTCLHPSLEEATVTLACEVGLVTDLIHHILSTGKNTTLKVKMPEFIAVGGCRGSLFLYSLYLS